MIDKKVEQNFENESSSDEPPAALVEEVKEEEIEDNGIEPSGANLSSNLAEDNQLNDF